MDKERLIHKFKHNRTRTVTLGKWILFAIVMGILLGFAGALFYKCIAWATAIRTAHWQFLFLLPFGAVIIKFLYKFFHDENDSGTNLVLSAIHSDDEIPLRMAPLIFVSTVLSHLAGASVGREGAALQLGGSVGNAFGKLFHFSDDDRHIAIMCGMSAAFSALFGTPMAAAVFSMEVVSVGIMHYAALVPCVVAAFIARGVAAKYCGVAAPHFDLEAFPDLNVISGFEICILAILCGLVSILFCVALRQSDRWAHHFVKNPYQLAFLGGCVILAMNLIVLYLSGGQQTYAGAGVDMISECISGENHPAAFLLKILFTALAITVGYKGGEIVPSFFIGASFGSLFGNLIGLSPSLCAAVGIGAVFCGVTNSPITALLICLELFGMDGMPYYLLAIAFSYMVSGYYGLYSSQKIIYSKYKSNYINRKTH